MDRFKEFVATGEAPDGRLYAGDLLLFQDLVAALEDFTQTIDLSTLRVGSADLQLLKYGSGEFRMTGALRIDKIFRALGGYIPPGFTTAARDAIPVGQAPYGLHILNTTVNKVQWNAGTDDARVWLDVSGSDFWSPFLPTADEKAAMAGTEGHPDAGNPFVTDEDPRLGGATVVDDLDTVPTPTVPTVVWLRIGASPPFDYEQMFYDAGGYNRWTSLPKQMQVEAQIDEGSASFAIQDGFTVGSGQSPIVVPWGTSRNDKGLVAQMRIAGFLWRAAGTSATLRIGWRSWNNNDLAFTDKTTGLNTVPGGEKVETSGNAKMVDTGWQEMVSPWTTKDWLEVGPALKAAGSTRSAKLLLPTVYFRWMHTPA